MERIGKRERERKGVSAVQYGKSKEMVIDRRGAAAAGVACVREGVSRTWLFKKNSAKEERTRLLILPRFFFSSVVVTLSTSIHMHSGYRFPCQSGWNGESILPGPKRQFVVSCANSM